MEFLERNFPCLAASMLAVLNYLDSKDLLDNADVVFPQQAQLWLDIVMLNDAHPERTNHDWIKQVEAWHAIRWNMHSDAVHYQYLKYLRFGLAKEPVVSINKDVQYNADELMEAWIQWSQVGRDILMKS